MVRCAGRKVSELKNRDVVDYVPILGRPDPTVFPELGGYSTSQGAIFTEIPGTPVIDMIDLKVVVNNITYYLYVSSRRYEQLVFTWNNWINKFSATMTGLCTIGGEHGISALLMNYWSEQQKYVPFVPVAPPPVTSNLLTKPQMKKSSSVKHLVPGTNIQLARVSIPDPNSMRYDSVYSVRTRSVFPIMASSWKYTSLMVKPIWMFLDQDLTACDQMLASLYAETKAMQHGSVQTGNDTEAVLPDVISRIESAAAKDVKAVFTDAKTELEVEFDALAEQGRGGLFTSLASMFGDAIGVPAISNIARAVGKVVDV